MKRDFRSLIQIISLAVLIVFFQNCDDGDPIRSTPVESTNQQEQQGNGPAQNAEKKISATATTSNGRLIITVENAGNAPETKTDTTGLGGLDTPALTQDWTSLDSSKWNLVGGTWILNQPLERYQQNMGYNLFYRDKDKPEDLARLTILIPESEIEATATTDNGLLVIEVKFAGTSGETSVVGNFGFTPFDASRWAYSEGIWRLQRDLSNYPSGSTYEMGFRNPNSSNQDKFITVSIP